MQVFAKSFTERSGVLLTFVNELWLPVIGMVNIVKICERLGFYGRFRRRML